MKFGLEDKKMKFRLPHSWRVKNEINASKKQKKMSELRITKTFCGKYQYI